jgi:glycosyltransferase involved in cell wall biosynthesis
MSNIQPLISVIIPVFNAERYIDLALNSVCNQTYPNLEILVIDDGSSDQSREIIESINDERIKFYSRENRGLISTLNEAIELSKGQYIARMDADDICFKTRFEKQVEFLKSNKDIGVAFTGIECVNEDGKIIRSRVSRKTRSIQPVEFLFGCPLCHPTAMFDMTKLSKSDIHYKSDYHLAEDFELWTRLVLRTKIALINEALLSYRIHQNSITSRNGGKQRLVAKRAISTNLINNKSNSVSPCLTVIYNNHLSQESVFRTALSLIHVGLKLKSLNGNFRFKKYLINSYFLMKNKLKKNKNSRTIN